MPIATEEIIKAATLTKKPVSAGAIAGGVIGALAFAALVGAGIVIWRKKRQVKVVNATISAMPSQPKGSK